MEDERRVDSRVAGRCRGVLLARWAEHLERRFGADAVRRVRERSGVPRDVVPDAPSEQAWFPVAAQLALTDAIAVELFEGDRERMVEAALEDGRAATGALAKGLLRTLGPGRVIARAGDLHPHAYDVGRVRAHVQGKSAELRYQGAALFGDATWQLLSCAATRGLIELSGRRLLEMRAEPAGEDSFTLHIRWT